MRENEESQPPRTGPTADDAKIRQELEAIRDRLADILQLLMPGVDHHLLTLTDGRWPHSEALEMSILTWLEEALLAAERCEPQQQTLLDDDGKTVHVLAQHLVDDYWWVIVAGAGTIISGNSIAGTGPGVSLAIARVKGSGRRMPYNAHNSGRFS